MATVPEEGKEAAGGDGLLGDQVEGVRLQWHAKGVAAFLAVGRLGLVAPKGNEGRELVAAALAPSAASEADSWGEWGAYSRSGIGGDAVDEGYVPGWSEAPNLTISAVARKKCKRPKQGGPLPAAAFGAIPAAAAGGGVDCRTFVSVAALAALSGALTSPARPPPPVLEPQSKAVEAEAAAARDSYFDTLRDEGAQVLLMAARVADACRPGWLIWGWAAKVVQDGARRMVYGSITDNSGLRMGDHVKKGIPRSAHWKFAACFRTTSPAAGCAIRATWSPLRRW